MSSTDRPGRSRGSYDLQSAFSSRDSQKAAELHDSWAEDCERSVTSWGYTTPAAAAGLISRYVKRGDRRVLDAGAGTRITGEVLTLLGCEDLVSIGVSRKILEHTRTKGMYKDLRQMEFGGR